MKYKKNMLLPPISGSFRISLSVVFVCMGMRTEEFRFVTSDRDDLGSGLHNDADTTNRK